MRSHSSLPLIFSPRVDKFQRQNISHIKVYRVYNVKKEERSQSSDTFCLWRYKWNFITGPGAQNIAFHLLKVAGNNNEMCGEVFIYVYFSSECALYSGWYLCIFSPNWLWPRSNLRRNSSCTRVVFIFHLGSCHIGTELCNFRFLVFERTRNQAECQHGIEKFQQQQKIVLLL